MFSFQGTIQNLKRFNEIPTFSVETSVSLLLILYSLLLITLKEWWARTRFPVGKPRRLQQSTGLLPRAAFRVHFGSRLSELASLSLDSYYAFARSGGPKWTRTIDLTIISRVL